ncbi:hypothetical protein ACWDRX_23685, partial [Streptomyces nigra]
WARRRPRTAFNSPVGTPDPLIVGAADTLLEAGEEATDLSPTPLFPGAEGPGKHPDTATTRDLDVGPD